MTLTVSVALGTYNGARFIETQVRSILNQTLLPDEIVLSDDGSTDDTVEIVSRLLAENVSLGISLVLVGTRERLGVARNFERALRACSGDLIALCDQDDRWHENRLSAAVPFFEQDTELLVQNANARLVGPTGVPLGVSLFEGLSVANSERELVAGGRAFEVYIKRNIVTGATVLLRKSVVELSTPFPAGWVHDEWIAMNAASHGGVIMLDEQLIDYRQHGSNEIGVARPTLRYRIGRMLQARGTRYLDLAERSRTLADRMAAIDSPYLRLAEEKAQFEEKRAAYPARRLPRIPAICRSARDGSYRRLSSQGDFDIIRDLIQPA